MANIILLLAAGLASVSMATAAEPAEPTAAAEPATSICAEAEVYPLAAFVEARDDESDIVIFRDFSGRAWTMAEPEDWQPGDVAALTEY